ncbi:MAG: histidine phosphatase family protein [Candidatus Marinimicrobia bacterium]|nr:histidine phosphatase family protein [Candidatus Neomarinimicrobiota bacterium]
MTTLVLIRHGETDWNQIGRYQGQADPSMNEAGFTQARNLVTQISHIKLNILYSSPLKRALQTAQIVAQELNLPLQTDSRLKEINQGVWQTQLHSEIQAEFPDQFRQWESHPWTITPPGGESLPAVRKRIDDFVDEVIQINKGQVIGLVTHRIPIAIVKIRFQGLDPDIVRTIEISNTYWEAIEI